MRVLFVSSELAPYSKTGGLGDVAAALPRALARLGHEVMVMSPLYGCVDRPGLERWGALEGGDGIWGLRQDGLRFAFLEHERLYGRRGVYGDARGDYPDNAERFAFLSLAALPAARSLDFEPDVLHLNDWQTGPAALAGAASGAGPGTVFTIHNLGYQGLFPMSAERHLPAPGALDPAGWTHYGQIAYLKAGITSADLVTTVSPSYAREIRGEALGFGLHEVLQEKGDRLVGILNGIDKEEWDPSSDPHLPAHYSIGNLEGKRRCRAALCEAMGISPTAEELVVGLVSRIAGQKGFDLLVPALPTLAEKGMRFAILGTGDPELERALLSLAKAHPGRIGVHLGFDEGMARRVYAGSDAFLMPSLYEPCGLSQLYALRYGAVPVVRRTGGLRDTVDEGETGFLFDAYEVEAMVAALERARAAHADPQRWAALVRRGMERDFSWDASARSYEAVYRRAIAASEGAQRPVVG